MHPILTGSVGKVIQDKRTLSCDSAAVAYGNLAEPIGLALQSFLADEFSRDYRVVKSAG